MTVLWYGHPLDFSACNTCLFYPAVQIFPRAKSEYTLYAPVMLMRMMLMLDNAS